MKNMTDEPLWVLPLRSEQTILENVGGKGFNLSLLSNAGFQVPDGFHVTTKAYRDYLAFNHLEDRITRLLETIDTHDPKDLENASVQIRALFSAGNFSDEMVFVFQNAYQTMEKKAVAVRSSATAEDLPEMSFAGQQDTFLNVVGVDSLLKSIIDCWSSLWTARAIGYRDRNQVPHHHVALAVVVQEMIESQTSGVMFTANPLTGLRTETVIDAAFGLGEALVSGRVDPDHYVVNPVEGIIVSKKLGVKELAIHGLKGGGTQEEIQQRTEVQALSDKQILALTSLGQQIEMLYGFPQDIEWALADEQLYILQSRPITSLFPLPGNLPIEPLKVLFSFAAVQGMHDPLTPLGIDTIREIFACAAGLFGIRVTSQTQTVMYAAGERLWINFTTLLSNSVGRRIIPTVLNQVEPTIRQAVEQIWDDPRLQPGRPGISFHARTQLARFFVPLFANVILNMISPQRRRRYIVSHSEKILEKLQKQCTEISGDRWQKLSQRSYLLEQILNDVLKYTFTLFVSGVAAGMASWNMMNNLVKSAAKETSSGNETNIQDLFLQVTRGMPYNPTTEMDLILWQIAKTLQKDEPSRQAFDENSAAELAKRYHNNKLPPLTLQQVKKFLDRYGGRGLGEIDLGRKRWATDPTHVFEMLHSFLQITDEKRAPDIVFARGVESAEQAIQQLTSLTRKARHGWIKARLVRFLASRARQLMGLRENPKFFVVRLMWFIQRELLKSGQEFVQAGELEHPNDVLYLSFDEIRALAVKENKDWHELISVRRETFQREHLRRQIPRLLLSDGRAFYEGLTDADSEENGFHGSPVSPGIVEGRVRVVLDPRQANLKPGEIMVCPGTDPSWTPLFLSAGGLVMETGGMMTHGAVVAREYGIPAIVGVNRATQRLHTGQQIRVDGSSGRIVILEE